MAIEHDPRYGPWMDALDRLHSAKNAYQAALAAAEPFSPAAKAALIYAQSEFDMASRHLW
jgi:hypothetical protein